MGNLHFMGAAAPGERGVRLSPGWIMSSGAGGIPGGAAHANGQSDASAWTLGAGAYTLVPPAVAGTPGGTLSGGLSGSGGLAVFGGGTLTLTGANTYTGGTTVHAGTLAPGAGGSLAATGAVSLAESGAGFDISAGGNQTIGALAGVSGSTITLGANTLTFGDSTNQTFAGNVAGTGGLTKQGGGTQTLGDTNTFTGSTTINSGTVQLAQGSGSAYAGMLALTGTGTCALDTGGTSVTFGGLGFGQNIKGTNATVTGGGSLTIAGSTQVALASSVNGDGYTQTFSIAGGTNVAIPNLLLGSDSEFVAEL